MRTGALSGAPVSLCLFSRVGACDYRLRPRAILLLLGRLVASLLLPLAAALMRLGPDLPKPLPTELPTPFILFVPRPVYGLLA